jgi:NADH-ubiquinone oxidoreductase chain 5
MGLVLIILAFGSIFIGYLTSDMVLGLGSPFFGNSLFISANHFNLVEAEFLSYFIKLVPVIFSILGAISALFLYFITFSYLFLLKLGLKNVYLFLNKKWFFDKVYNYFLISKIMRFGYYVSYKLMDKGLVEMFGPLGLVRMFTFFSFRVSLLQTGFIYQYIFFMFVGLILFLGVFYLIPFFLYFYSFIFLISTPLCFIFFITFVVLAL